MLADFRAGGDPARPLGGPLGGLAVGAWLTVLGVISLLVLLAPARRTVYNLYAHSGRCWVSGRDMYLNLDRLPGMDGYRYSPLVVHGFVVLSRLPDGLGGVDVGSLLVVPFAF